MPVARPGAVPIYRCGNGLRPRRLTKSTVTCENGREQGVTMSSDATDAATRGPGEYAESHTIPLPEDAAALPEGFAALQQSPEWWAARPAGARLVGLVVAREDMPSIALQREALAGFGVPIGGFRHPAPETGESWIERLTRLFGRLGPGDVVV